MHTQRKTHASHRACVFTSPSLTEESSAPQGAQACEADSDISFQCAQFSEALISRFAMLLNRVPIPMMQPYCTVLHFDVHIISYEEWSSSSSADVSDEPKKDDEESEASESEAQCLVALGCP